MVRLTHIGKRFVPVEPNQEIPEEKKIKVCTNGQKKEIKEVTIFS